MLKGLIEYCEENLIEFKLNEPMKCHTSFKIGGEADIFISVSSATALIGVIEKCGEYSIPYFIIGKGSNLLVSDNGIRGAVISLSGLNKITACGEIITCDTGVALSELCRFSLENSLSGLEFAYGIPGSVGGAVFMNAGAYGGEMADIIVSAECLTKAGEKITVNAEDMDLGYRKSIFKQNGMIVLNVTFKLEKGSKSEIEAKMNDFICRRRDKQPLEYPSAGSFFKRPEGNFAGALIEKNGLKGFKVGGAQVSEKHAGFVINCGGATCKDVNELGKQVAEKIFMAENILLEREVIFVGEE